jgi:hypothetical protein
MLVYEGIFHNSLTGYFLARVKIRTFSEKSRKDGTLSIKHVSLSGFPRLVPPLAPWGFTRSTERVILGKKGKNHG